MNFNHIFGKCQYKTFVEENGIHRVYKDQDHNIIKIVLTNGKEFVLKMKINKENSRIITERIPILSKITEIYRISFEPIKDKIFISNYSLDKWAIDTLYEQIQGLEITKDNLTLVPLKEEGHIVRTPNLNIKFNDEIVLIYSQPYSPEYVYDMPELQAMKNYMLSHG